MQPDKSLHLRPDACVAGKHSKFSLTRMAAANAMGNIPQMLS